MAIPDFGNHVVYHEGVPLSCKYQAPGLTFSDLEEIFYKAEAELKPEDYLSGNPSKWPNSRGIYAVTQAILEAIYNKSETKT